MNIVKRLNKNKFSYFYIAIILVLLIFILSLFFSPFALKNNQNNSQIKDVNVETKSFYSKVTVPENYNVVENTAGSGVEYKVYDQTITSADGKMKIIIESIPKNIEKRVNTGVDINETPYYALQSLMVKIGGNDTTGLYREDAEKKYFYASQEYARQEPNNFLTSDGLVRFDIFTNTNDPSKPYINTIKTPTSQEARIYAFITYTPVESDFMQYIKELDKIIQSLKI